MIQKLDKGCFCDWPPASREKQTLLELFLLVNGACLKIETRLTTPRFGTNKPTSTQIGTGTFTAYTMWGLGVKTIAAWAG